MTVTTQGAGEVCAEWQLLKDHSDYLRGRVTLSHNDYLRGRRGVCRVVARVPRNLPPLPPPPPPPTPSPAPPAPIFCLKEEEEEEEEGRGRECERVCVCRGVAGEGRCASVGACACWAKV
mmetsp:Transcript_70923/g.115168  ORF Transcript_70923/g.115168 Transcript_70923/m.115168 type:complete len:120 (-) Transcript_70923:127-486(-)